MQTTVDVGYGLDASGNLANVEKTTVTNTTFDNDITNWLVGFVSDRQVTVSNVPGETGSITAVQENTKLSSSTLRTGQSTTFKNTDYESTTNILSVDGYGNPTGVEISGPSFNSRTSHIANFVDGRYPTTITNAEGHQVTVNNYDLRFGVPETVTDSNNLQTTSLRDNLGRVVETTLSNGTVITPNVELCFGYCDAVAGFTQNIAPAYKSYAQVTHASESYPGAPASLDDRGGKTRLGEDHHAGCRLQQVRAGARADDEEEGVLDLAVQPDDAGQPAEHFTLAALAQHRAGGGVATATRGKGGGSCGAATHSAAPSRPVGLPWSLAASCSRRAARSLRTNCAAFTT